MAASTPSLHGARVTRVPGVHQRRVGGKVFLVMNDGTMHVLDNATATAVWERVVAAGDDGVTLADLSGTLVDRFRVEQVQATEDVTEFVRQLVAGGALALETDRGH